MSSSLVGVMLGLGVGLRHAFEPDHLTAVVAMSAEPGHRHGATLGALWGLGHTVALVVVGVILLALGTVVPAKLTVMFELAVSVALIALGVRAIVQAHRQGTVGPSRAHVHGGQVHRHAGPDAHVHLGTATLAWRPLAVGMIHGLAGSGALTVLVFAQLASTAARIGYLTLFGIGSIAGMSIASAIVGASMRSASRWHRSLMIAAGVVSIGVGIVWAVPLYTQLG